MTHSLTTICLLLLAFLLPASSLNRKSNVTQSDASRFSFLLSSSSFKRLNQVVCRREMSWGKFLGSRLSWSLEKASRWSSFETFYFANEFVSDEICLPKLRKFVEAWINEFTRILLQQSSKVCRILNEFSWKSITSNGLEAFLEIFSKSAFPWLDFPLTNFFFQGLSRRKTSSKFQA